MFDYKKARKNMVDNLIRPANVTSQKLLIALENVPRDKFLPNHLASLSYSETELLIENEINLPVHINGSFATTIQTKKGYDKDVILDTIYKLDKIKNKIIDKKVIKVINVQDKIINIIIS